MAPNRSFRLSGSLLVLATLGLLGPAGAHKAPTGWKYPWLLQQHGLPVGSVIGGSERPRATVIQSTGETVGYRESGSRTRLTGVSLVRASGRPRRRSHHLSVCAASRLLRSSWAIRVPCASIGTDAGAGHCRGRATS